MLINVTAWTVAVATGALLTLVSLVYLGNRGVVWGVGFALVLLLMLSLWVIAYSDYLAGVPGAHFGALGTWLGRVPFAGLFIFSGTVGLGMSLLAEASGEVYS